LFCVSDEPDEQCGKRCAFFNQVTSSQQVLASPQEMMPKSPLCRLPLPSTSGFSSTTRAREQ
jgi:hypothetical protein